MKDASIRYINRELSWLAFNERVLAEASNTDNPLLERLKFLAIFESNLDEFYMVRVSGLIEQFESGVLETSPDGLSPNEQLVAISETASPLRVRAAEVLHQDLLPALEKYGVHLRDFDSLNDRQRRELAHYFQTEVFPLCTPLMLNPAPTVPFISNRSLNLCVELLDDRGDVRLARVKIPTVIPRLVRLSKRKNEFILLEDLVAEHVGALFPGVEIVGVHQFRVVRDADIEIRELEAADLITTIEETLRLRRFGDPVLLQVHNTMPDRVAKVLLGLLNLDDEDLFRIDGLLGMEVLWELTRIDKPSLRFKPHVPYVPEVLLHPTSLFESIRQRDVLVHHPYDSFRSVEEFISSASTDPDVIGIKQTMYRVGKESPLVESLLEAADEGKQVAAMVELKARFDESNNLVWARALERAGVHVTYGFPEMKVHCKLCLIVRREADGVRQYAHIGTGNYNASTARTYTDLGLFTADEALCQDIAELFNYLTGYSRQSKYRKLLVAPVNLREGILDRIRRETRLHRASGNGRIIFKINSLVDPEIIDALYTASQAGVDIDLIVRGICCLRPGVEGMSERIRVRSVIGRFLEHSRVYFFGNGDDPDILIGSADIMRRNLDRRVEVLAPVESLALRKLIYDRMLRTFLADHVKAWELGADGVYRRSTPQQGKPLDSQAWGIAHPLTKYQFPPSAGPTSP
ncbi:MAG: polyphosphate kinase 1 [Fimbriimonadaceae bacterium]|nr:polyphosphate kinase 1 [Fimbriimonadaceae bacterium]